ncbi:MAG: response regulator transcription factor [Crocinitomicaceae bacterium]|jgi:two-component system alkaline phosphatase synthesis response regulator PhoP|nr:response regulator transcription factor [Crocinitomicaceae bacterium]
MKRIYLVEDEAVLLDSIKLNLEYDGYDVVGIKSGTEAFDNAKELGESDLVILDVMLPGYNGIQVCKEIRRFSDVPILFLSAKGTTPDRVVGLKAGGNDYLSKPFDLEELLLRVKVLLAIQLKTTAQNIFTIGSKTINFQTFEVCDSQEKNMLTFSKREVDLLQLFSVNVGRVISRDEILDTIWGMDKFPTPRTIDNYILTFRKVFEIDPKEPQHFHSIRGVGYKLTLG